MGMDVYVCYAHFSFACVRCGVMIQKMPVGNQAARTLPLTSQPAPPLGVAQDQ